MTRLDVVTGFLGAGKTTFLLRYCAYLKAQGARFTVIENEFGRAGVDSALLSLSGIEAEEISGGCVCCTQKTVLYQKLDALAGTVDRILVEPSGLFCGDDLMDVLASPAFSGRLSPGMWTAVVDPLSLPLLADEDFAVLQSELAWAGSVLLSKTAFCSPAEIASAGERLRAMFQSAAPDILREPEAPDAAFFARVQRGVAVFRPHERRLFDHTAQFQSATLYPEDLCCTEKTLENRLARLMQGAAGTVLRVKGVLTLSGAPYAVNCTPGCIALTPGGETAPLPCGLNIIGRALDRKGLRAILAGAA